MEPYKRLITEINILFVMTCSLTVFFSLLFPRITFLITESQFLGPITKETGKLHRAEPTASFHQWGDTGVNEAVSMATAALGSWPLWHKFNQHFLLAFSLLTITPHTYTTSFFSNTLSLSLAQCPLLSCRLSAWCIMCLEQKNIYFKWLYCAHAETGFMQCEITNSHYKFCDKIHSRDESIRYCMLRKSAQAVS